MVRKSVQENMYERKSTREKVREKKYERKGTREKVREKMYEYELGCAEASESLAVRKSKFNPPAI